MTEDKTWKLFLILQMLNNLWLQCDHLRMPKIIQKKIEDIEDMIDVVKSR